MPIDLHQFPLSRHNLQFILGEKELSVTKLTLKITNKINHHTKVTFSLPIDEPDKNQKVNAYLDGVLTNTTLQINLINLPVKKEDEKNQTKKDENQPEILFTGLITQLNLDVINQQYILIGEALSYTYKMDMQKNKRSFQNKQIAYNQLIKKVTEKYGSKVCHSRVTEDQKLGEIAVQYEETDWEFLVRVASRLHLGLVPSVINSEQWFIFGMPDGKETYILNEESLHDHQVIRNITEYQKLTANKQITVEEQDYLSYQVKNTKQYLALGDRVKNPAKLQKSETKDDKNTNQKDKKEKCLIVKQAVAQLDGGNFNYSYLLTPETGLRQPSQKHPRIKGASIEGRVLEVKGDQVKIHLHKIDKDQDPAQAAWFTYTTAYTAEKNTGWYVMPEKGDYIKLYFPTNNEAEAIASGSSRKTKDAKRVILSKPYERYLRTAHGKEIKFGNDEILISGYGKDDNEKSIVLIKMNETSGITIQSNNSNVMLYAKGALTVNSDHNLTLAAGNSLNIYCKTNSIEMNGPTLVKGLSKDN